MRRRVEVRAGEALGGFVGCLFGQEAIVLDYELGRSGASGGGGCLLDDANFFSVCLEALAGRWNSES